MILSLSLSLSLSPLPPSYTSLQLRCNLNQKRSSVSNRCSPSVPGVLNWGNNTMMPRQDHHRQQRQQSRVLYELSSLVLNLLRSPPSPAIHFSDHVSSPSTAISSSFLSSSSEAPARRIASVSPITPAGFASLMLGISLSLMLSGAVTFFIGFMLFPWVIGLFIVFYFVGFVSTLSVLGRAFICYAISPASSPPSPRKDIPAWKFL